MHLAHYLSSPICLFASRCWSSLLDVTADKAAAKSSQWWFHIYSLLQQFRTGAVENASIGRDQLLNTVILNFSPSCWLVELKRTVWSVMIIFIPLSFIFSSLLNVENVPEINELVQAFQKFIESSTLGEFHSRVKMLFVFYKEMCSVEESTRNLKGIFINWFMVSVRPSSYGGTREVAKHERTVRATRSDSWVRL